MITICCTRILRKTLKREDFKDFSVSSVLSVYNAKRHGDSQRPYFCLTKLRDHAGDQHNLAEMIGGNIIDSSVLNGGYEFIPRENDV